MSTSTVISRHREGKGKIIDGKADKFHWQSNYRPRNAILYRAVHSGAIGVLADRLCTCIWSKGCRHMSRTRVMFNEHRNKSVHVVNFDRTRGLGSRNCPRYKFSLLISISFVDILRCNLLNRYVFTTSSGEENSLIPSLATEIYSRAEIIRFPWRQCQ